MIKWLFTVNKEDESVLLEIQEILVEFKDLVSDELPNELPIMRNIGH